MKSQLAISMLGRGINQKTLLVILLGLFMLVAGWRLAFERTIEAVSLNRRLQEQSSGGAMVADNPDYLRKKNELLNLIVNKYKADSAEWKNSFWLNISRMAIHKHVNIQYSPTALKLNTDSASKSILKQRITFEGSYRNLVLLLDTLEKSEKAGYVSSLTFESQKKLRSQEEEKKLFLDVEFGVLKK